jgi:ArsR family transcriptional regulator, virulence genes transcriptional regulator
VAASDALDPNLRAELEELTASVCRALNDPKRLLLLYAVAQEPRSVGELGELLGASQSNVSQHLAVLRDGGLVDAARDANRVIYSLRDARVVDAIDLLRGVMNDELARRHALRGSS